MEHITIILIAISLSIDAFTLSVAYGLLNIKKEKIILTSLLVSLFHFFMPLIGIMFGKLLINTFSLNSKGVLIITLSIILVEMIKSNNKEFKEKNMNFLESLTFAFLVSIDSFLIGTGLNYFTSKVIISSIYFSISSFIFTMIGFFLGKFITNKLKKTAKIISIIILFTLIIYFLCK